MPLQRVERMIHGIRTELILASEQDLEDIHLLAGAIQELERILLDGIDIKSIQPAVLDAAKRLGDSDESINL